MNQQDAGEAAASSGLPPWLVITVVIWGMVGPLVTATLTYVASRHAANQATAAARDLHSREVRRTLLEHERSIDKSNRELIMWVLELVRSPDERSQRQGQALFAGLSQLPYLSESDAILIRNSTREVTESVLSEARKVVADGETVLFEVDVPEEAAGGQ